MAACRHTAEAYEAKHAMLYNHRVLGGELTSSTSTSARPASITKSSCNVEGQQFVCPRQTRDVKASAVIRGCTERGKAVATPSGARGVWLDSPMIGITHGSGTIHKALPAMVRQFARFDIDITENPVLVYRTLHYQNGGISLKPDRTIHVPNLFAAGEISRPVHGRNRLMGNWLLEVTVFGRRAGKTAALRAREVRLGKLTWSHVDEWRQALEEAGIENPIKSPVLLPDYRRKLR